MNIEEYREYCISKPGVTEGFPFDSNTLVFKVMEKMFALTNIDLFASINLKCDPDYAIELREKHEGIKPGFHMSKKHWNTCDTKNDISDDLLRKLIDDSYNLVASKLTKILKEELKKL
ncbi:MmcQ/YjbR family DNA-binding protein [Flavobacteriales bacterium]|nr:MmcQ/YjbR family DNA-binding protein [Flavobacteriales bacterium]MDB4089317.1 MmcQ/YjbR family DNA-binding protein [Flavobacteriales bacterium]